MTKSVLIVDDEVVLSTAYELALSKAGFTVYVAERGQQGLELVEKHHPQLILLDMLMPEMNGIDFLNTLREKKLLKTTKVIAFSNIDNPEVVTAAKKAGATDYLLKVNYTPHEVTELVAKLLK